MNDLFMFPASARTLTPSPSPAGEGSSRITGAIQGMLLPRNCRLLPGILAAIFLSILSLSCSHDVAGTETGNQGEITAHIRIPVPPAFRTGSGTFSLAGTHISTTLSSYREWIDLDSTAADSSATILFRPVGGEIADTVWANIAIPEALPDTVLVVEPYLSCSHSARIGINTSAGGADIAEDQFAFPLLIRLDNTAGILSQMQPDGSDIRFMRADGVPLPYEIERMGADSAEIWVKVDTIHAQDASQYITMVWGDTSFHAAASPLEVFGDSSAFRGVWHMPELSGSLRNSANEALPLADGRTLFQSTAGVAAAAQNLSLENDSFAIVNPGAFFKPAQVTVSAWIKPSLPLDSNGGEIISMGDSYMLRVRPDSLPMFALFPVDTPIWLEEVHGSTSIVDGNWHHICGSYDGSTLSLYIDGVLSSTLADSKGIIYNQGQDLIVGRHGNNKLGYQYSGGIDELRVSPYCESGERVKLAVKNLQWAGDCVSIVVVY